jgi:Spy/CpxP family protein refolding chaperone
MMPEVQKELKLDAKQLDKLGKLGANQQRPDPGMNPDARRKAFAEMRKKRDADVAKILNPTQTTRWRQLEIQRAGARALDRDDVAKAIKLTPDQRKKIDAVNDAERDEMRKLFQGMQGGPGGGPGGGGRPGAGGPGGGSGGGRPGAGGPGGGPGGGGEAFSKMRSLREGTDTKLMAVLTPPQKKSFQALQGAPFKFPARRFGGPGGGGPGGGGPGGFGGRGGGGRPDGGRPQGGQPRRPEGAGRA